MTVPQFVLLVFALWTLLVPLGAIAAYRWGRILSGRAAIDAFRADRVEGADWYRRAMRAHANCVENLPVLGAIVLALTVLRLDSEPLNVLAWILIGARAAQSLVHICFVETPKTVSVRFSFFLTQVVCMLVLGGAAASAYFT